MPPRDISRQILYSVKSFDSERLVKGSSEEWQRSVEGGSGKQRGGGEETEPLGLTVLAREKALRAKPYTDISKRACAPAAHCGFLLTPH